MHSVRGLQDMPAINSAELLPTNFFDANRECYIEVTEGD